MFELVVGLLAGYVALRIGKWRQQCLFWDEHGGWNAPSLWRQPYGRLGSLALTAAAALLFATAISDVIGKAIHPWVGQFSWGALLALRWYLSKLLATRTLNRFRQPIDPAEHFRSHLDLFGAGESTPTGTGQTETLGRPPLSDSFQEMAQGISAFGEPMTPAESMKTSTPVTMEFVRALRGLEELGENLTIEPSPTGVAPPSGPRTISAAPMKTSPPVTLQHLKAMGALEREVPAKASPETGQTPSNEIAQNVTTPTDDLSRKG